MPAIKRIVGEHLLVESTFQQDTHEATDLLVLEARDRRIACRVREPGYLRRYDNQITIRSRIDGVQTTEIDKFLRGWADYMFYGHGSGEPKWDIVKWWLINLDHFVFHHGSTLPFIRIAHDISNGDGTYFDVFDLTKFPPEPPILIAASHSWGSAA